MKTDALFYRIAKELPDSFFELIGEPPSLANRYRFGAVEIKDTAVRIDGLYMPIRQDNAAVLYFVEFQNYRSMRTYSNMLLKVGLYLEKINPEQNWLAVIVYPNRNVEQENKSPYRFFLESDQLLRIYLDELPDPPPEKLGFAVLKLMAAKPAAALVQAQALIPRVRTAALSMDLRHNVIDLIETIVLYQYPQISRQELEKMLQVNDVRETKVFQEALEEGIEKGREEGREEGKRLGVAEAQKAFARRLLEKGHSVQETADLTGLSLANVKRLKKERKQ